MSEYIEIVFDGPPGPEAGRFVEVENLAGASIKAGEWSRREDGYWVLRLLHDGEPEASRPNVQEALDCIESYGCIDGDHHKMWVLDQVVRQLTGDQYENWVRNVKAGEDGPDTYGWDEGIAP